MRHRLEVELVSGLPDYLLTHLIRSGYLAESLLSRRARLKLCRPCGLIVMTGLDDDTCAIEATCDPRPLTAQGEALAWLSGLRTWSLRKRARFELDARTSHEIADRPAGSEARHDVLVQHRCHDRAPVTWFGPSSFVETAPRLAPGSPAPF